MIVIMTLNIDFIISSKLLSFLVKCLTFLRKLKNRRVIERNHTVIDDYTKISITCN